VNILMLGDSPFIQTGFGIVNAQACEALVKAGHKLVVLGGQDTKERDPEDFTFIPVTSLIADMLGWSQVDKIIEDYKIDAIHIIADPATVSSWLIRDKVASLPIVAYVPIEGEPLNERWIIALRGANDLHLLTCSNYGVSVLDKAGFSAKMVYHGVSGDFMEATPETKQSMRSIVGWEDKFVVMMVAQNVHRKQWPRVFEAVVMLRKRIPELILYAHTTPFNNFWLGGHDLPQMAIHMGIDDIVVFPSDHMAHNDATPLWGNEKPGLVDLYNMADAFVLPSQVEGFGLPLAEAMRVGLPVITTDYAAGAEVVGKAGILLPVNDWDYNQSHSKYANVAPRDIASAIERLYKSQELRRQYARKGQERAEAFTWDSYREAIVEEFDAIATRLPETRGESVLQTATSGHEEVPTQVEE